MTGFRALGLSADESDASLTLAEYWIGQSKPSQSAAALPVSKIPRFAQRMRRAILAARVASAQGQARESARRLKALGLNLQAKKWMGLSLEARLASAEAKLKFDRTAARNDVAVLKQETGALGFGLLARTAAELH